MWADDREWLPYLLRSERFVGEFVFDGDNMVSGGVRSDKVAELSPAPFIFDKNK